MNRVERTINSPVLPFSIVCCWILPPAVSMTLETALLPGDRICDVTERFSFQ